MYFAKLPLLEKKKCFIILICGLFFFFFKLRSHLNHINLQCFRIENNTIQNFLQITHKEQHYDSTVSIDRDCGRSFPVNFESFEPRSEKKEKSSIDRSFCSCITSQICHSWPPQGEHIHQQSLALAIRFLHV